MGIALKNIVKEKYCDTDINSLVFHFDDTKEESFVSEFDVPEEMPYMVLLSKRPDLEYPSWIEIVNPEALNNVEEVLLPDLGLIDVSGRLVTLKELINDAMN